MADIFINYRTSDEAYAAVLLDEKLCERFGRDRVFRDTRSIGPGEDFRPRLWGALAKAAIFIVVIGQDWLQPDTQGRRKIDDPDDFVRREIDLALKIGIHVIPVLVGKISQLESKDLPEDIAPLAHRQYRRLSPRGVQREISQIVDEVAGILGEATPHPGRDDPVPGPWTAAMLRIENLGGRRDALRTAVELAAVRAELPAPELTDWDLGIGVLVPPSVPPIRLAAGFVGHLNATLAQQSVPPVRIGLCQGAVDGRVRDVLAYLSELVDQPELEGVLRRARRARLVLVVPDAFFNNVIRADPDLVDPSTFLPFVAGTGGARHWVHVPGYPAPPGLAVHPAPVPTPAGPEAGHPVATIADNHGIVLLQQGPTHGDQFAGDKVMGDKHVYDADGSRR